eukprot:TRINITY_DN1895_c0_g3_i1.p1 TRINITY_DN1895_c0_g3~~TRINITY_DN1895_c0_g3_i1.p1  ORF type:complete len:266 (+),score=36.98 TRINITY_DN1895_c0_g3_i1:51-848(+)
MEVFLMDAATGVKYAADIELDDKPESLKRVAHTAFGYPADDVEAADMRLSVGAKAVCDDEPLGSAGVEAGCVVDITLCPDRHLDAVASGLKRRWEVPLWATTRAEVIQSIPVEVDNWLESAHITVQRDREIVLAAVQRNGASLKYADDTLKGDREIVLAAVQNGYVLTNASDTMRADREIALAAVRHHCWAVNHVHDTLRGDREIVLAAVRNGWLLKNVEYTLRGDREIVLAAVQQHKWALKYAHPALHGDPELLRLAAGVALAR